MNVSDGTGRTIEGATEAQVTDALAALVSDPNQFVVLDAPPTEYLQSAHCGPRGRRDPDRLLLEHHDATTGRHMGTAPLPAGEAVEGLLDFFRGGSGWRTRWQWIEMRLAPSLEPDVEDLAPAALRRIDPADDEIAEEWVRVVDDRLRGASAARVPARAPWSWSVWVDLAESLREEPLEGELRQVVPLALRSVAGVTDVREEDREQWMVEGDPSGRDLVAAAGRAADALAGRARIHLDDLLA